MLKRLAGAMLAVLMMTACAPKVAPPGPQAGAAAVLSESVFNTSDGLQLPVRRWLPDLMDMVISRRIDPSKQAWSCGGVGHPASLGRERRSVQLEN